MTLVMAYVILIAAGAAACAVVLEAFLRGRGAGARWVWVLAMGFTTAATLFAMFAPRSSREVPVEREVAVSNLLSLRTAETPLVTPATSVSSAKRLIEVADLTLPPSWLVATLVLLIALAVGQRRFRMERHAAREANVVGHPVLLTENLGPAVAGVRRPVVFVPRWVLALDAGSQRLLLAHEMEHVKGRDTSLLLFGAVTAALTPWNPVVWWMVRRLRLAVEQDCDARVLATYPGVRRYADLLLMAASRHGLTARLLAAHFGEHSSDLVRRIEAMTSKNIPLRTIVGAGFVAAALVAAACEAPRPEPVAPIPVKPTETVEQLVSENPVRSEEFTRLRAECDASWSKGCSPSVIVIASDGKEMARYAGEIPVAHLPPDGIGNIKVEEGACGANSCSIIWLTWKPGQSLRKAPLTEARILNAERQRFEAWKVDSAAREVEVPQVRRKQPSTSAEQEFERRVEAEKVLAKLVETRGDTVLRGEGFVTLPADSRIRWRDPSKLAEMPNFVVKSSDGAEIRRVIADPSRTNTTSPIDDIRSEDIAAIEVYKGSSCPTSANISCPLISITLKPCRDAAYRKR